MQKSLPKQKLSSWLTSILIPTFVRRRLSPNALAFRSLTSVDLPSSHVPWWDQMVRLFCRKVFCMQYANYCAPLDRERNLPVSSPFYTYSLTYYLSLNFSRTSSLRQDLPSITKRSIIRFSGLVTSFVSLSRLPFSGRNERNTALEIRIQAKFASLSITVIHSDHARFQ